MQQETAGSHRETTPAQEPEADTPHHTEHSTDERTGRVLQDADEVIDMIDEVLYGDITDEQARNEYARSMVTSFQQKGGQ